MHTSGDEVSPLREAAVSNSSNVIGPAVPLPAATVKRELNRGGTMQRNEVSRVHSIDGTFEGFTSPSLPLQPFLLFERGFFVYDVFIVRVFTDFPILKMFIKNLN